MRRVLDRMITNHGVALGAVAAALLSAQAVAQCEYWQPGLASPGDSYDVVDDRPVAASPLIDAGESHPDLPATDILGNPRVRGEAVDIGAYEFPSLLTVDETPHETGMLELEQNHPNPCGASAAIRFRLPARQHVRLAVFDLAGRQVATLVNGELDAGFMARPHVSHRTSPERGYLSATPGARSPAIRSRRRFFSSTAAT